MTNFELELDRLTRRVQTLERFAQFLASRLDMPAFYRGVNESGFRYRNPNCRHFILLRACRMVSGLNAAISLARTGFSQEIGVVLRAVIEYYTQVEYVLSHSDQGEPTGKAASFIQDFFADDRRTGPTAIGKRVKLNQKEVHDAVGKTLDEFSPKDAGQRNASQLMSHVYLVFSNYVHGRYPESMDLYGGRPGRFHLQGMRGTPKDSENLEIIDTLTTSVSNCLIQVVQGLGLREAIKSDDELGDWYERGVGVP